MERRIPFSPIFTARREDVIKYNVAKLSNNIKFQMQPTREVAQQRSFLNKSEAQNSSYKKTMINTAGSSRNISTKNPIIEYTGLLKTQSNNRLPRSKLPMIEKDKKSCKGTPSNSYLPCERLSSPQNYRITPKVITRINFSPRYAELKSEENLKPVQKLVSIHSSVSSRTGKSNGKLKKFNQDSYISIKNYCNLNSNHLFSILDGHGTNGHTVSSYIKNTLPAHLEYYIPSIKPQNESSLNSSDIAALKLAFKKSYLKIQKDLILKSHIDVTFSGSTACTVLMRENHLICANVGDSRAVLGQMIDGHWIAMPLSRDHKPEEPSEKLRVENAGGRVEPMKGNR